MSLQASAPSNRLADAHLARAAVEAGIAAYFAERHARVASFAARHFSFAGTLRLHRAALGWDSARAPLNVIFAGPELGLHAAAALARRIGHHRLAAALSGHSLLHRTAVARRLDHLIRTELLELPDRPGARDALAEAILAQPALAARLAADAVAIGQHADDPTFRGRLCAAMAEYAAARGAAAEIATGLLTIGVGAITLDKLTPGAATLGPALAGQLAQQAAIAGFPLGPGLGSLWYGLYPAAPSAGLVAGATGGLAFAAAITAAFAGVVTDPLQRALGLHQRRLHRLIDALERQMTDPAAAGFALRDQYVARLLDLLDLLGAAWRLALH